MAGQDKKCGIISFSLDLNVWLGKSSGRRKERNAGLSQVGFIAILYGSEDLDSLVSLNVTEPPCVQHRARKT